MMKTIDPYGSALILIEFQNAWLGEGATLAALMQDRTQFETSKRQAKAVLTHARTVGMHVIHVPFIVSGDYRELGGEKAQMGLRAAIQRAGTWRGEAKAFHEAFTPLPDECIASGRVGASAFAGSNLDSILRNNEIKTLFLMGYATNVCVESTLRDAHDKGYDTYVVNDAVSAFTSEQKVFFETQIVHHFGGLFGADAFMNLQRG